MNSKRVSFSDINDVLTIPPIEGTRKLMFPWKKERVLYSNEDLKEQIKRRKEFAIRDAKRKFMDLERKYKDIKKYVLEPADDEDDEDTLNEYEICVGMMEDIFFEQSILTRKLLCLLADI